MPPMAFVSPRNTPDTVINSSRPFIIWSTEASWTMYDRYKIRRVDIRWPILATMHRWRVLFCTLASLTQLKCVLSYGCNSSPKVSEVGQLQGNLRLKSLERWLNYRLFSLYSFYQGAHEQVTGLPVAPVILVSGQHRTDSAVRVSEHEAGQCWENSLRDLDLPVNGSGKEIEVFTFPAQISITCPTFSLCCVVASLRFEFL